MINKILSTFPTNTINITKNNCIGFIVAHIDNNPQLISNEIIEMAIAYEKKLHLKSMFIGNKLSIAKIVIIKANEETTAIKKESYLRIVHQLCTHKDIKSFF
jgi:hypothetical protein